MWSTISSISSDFLDFAQIYWMGPDGIWGLAAIVCSLAVPLTFVAGSFDQRLSNGDPVSFKPFRFFLALAIHVHAQISC